MKQTNMHITENTSAPITSAPVQLITPYRWDGNSWSRDATVQLPATGAIKAPPERRAQPRAPLSLATINILHDASAWYVNAAVTSDIRYTALLGHLETIDADVLGLNEVTPRTLQLLLSCRFVRERYYVSESPELSNRSIHGVHGSVLFSKCPMSQLRLVQLGHGRSTAVMGLLEHPDAPPLAVCSVHMHALQTARGRSIRLDQMQIVVAAARSLCKNHVIMGDLNMHEPGEDAMLVNTKLLDLWTETRGSSPGFTFDPIRNCMIHRYIPGETRCMRLDRILLGEGALWAPRTVSIWGDKVVDSERELHLSDHFGLLVVLEPTEAPFQSSPEATNIVAANAQMPTHDHSVMPMRFVCALARHVPWLLNRMMFGSSSCRPVCVFSVLCSCIYIAKL